MPKYDQTQWMFLGSHLGKPGSDASGKVYERMTLPNRATSTSYKNKHQDPPTVLLDAETFAKATGKNYARNTTLINIGKSQVPKNSILDAIKAFFSEPLENSLLVYSGPAEEGTGDWVFEWRSESGELETYLVKYDEILALWKSRCHIQKHLLIVMDSSYSEHWVKTLIKYNDPSVSIQSACRRSDRATEDRKVGSYFIYNWAKIITNLKFDQINAPVKNAQVPCFYGNFYYLEMFYGIQLKFESWNDMRKALNASFFGDWPRMHKKENPYILQMNIQALESVPERQKTQMRSYQIPNANVHGHKLVAPPVNSDTRFQSCGCDKAEAIPDALIAKQNPVPPDEHFRLSKSFVQPMNEEQVLRNSSVNKSMLMRTGSMDAEAEDVIPANLLATDFVWEEGKFLGDYDRKGIKNGFGVLLDEDNRIIFQGQFKDNAKHGIGAVFTYLPERVKVFEGRYRNNLKNGKGQVLNPDRVVIFEGDFADDLRNGEGTEYYEDGLLKFEGSFKDDVRDGEGVEYYRNGVVKSRGNWKDGALHGPNVIYHYESGPVEYKGDYLRGKRTGVGKLYRENGDLRYQGELIDGEIHGKGIVWDEATNEAKEGYWEYGNPVEDSDDEDEESEVEEEPDFNEMNRLHRIQSIDHAGGSDPNFDADFPNDSERHPAHSSGQDFGHQDLHAATAILEIQQIDTRFDDTLHQNLNDLAGNQDRNAAGGSAGDLANSKNKSPVPSERYRNSTSKSRAKVSAAPERHQESVVINRVENGSQSKKKSGARGEESHTASFYANNEGDNGMSEEPGKIKKFSAPKLQPYQEELLDSAANKGIRPKAKNEVINAGNIYQSIKIESTFNAKPKALHRMKINAEQPEIASPIANGVVLRKKSQINEAGKPAVQSKQSLQASSILKESLINHHPELPQRSLQGSFVASKVSQASPGTKMDHERLVLSQMVVPEAAPIVRIVEEEEAERKNRILGRQDIKLKHIKPQEVSPQLLGSGKLDASGLPPRHTMALAQTFKSELAIPGLSASFKRAVDHAES